MCSQKVRWCRLPSGAVPAANLQHRQPNREHILQHPGETNISHSNEGISKQHETTKQSGRVSKRPGNAQRASSKDPSSLNHGENLCASVEVLNPERRDFKCPCLCQCLEPWRLNRHKFGSRDLESNLYCYCWGSPTISIISALSCCRNSVDTRYCAVYAFDSNDHSTLPQQTLGEISQEFES